MPAAQCSVFISYAHADNSEVGGRWLDRLLQFIQPLIDENQIVVWSDEEIEIGESWEEKVQNALQSATAAVLLVSPAFLASRYIRNSELPILLKNAKDRGLVVLPIILRPSLFHEAVFKYPDPNTGPDRLSLASLQAANAPSRPLNDLSQSEQDSILLNLARRLMTLAPGGDSLLESIPGEKAIAISTPGLHHQSQPVKQAALLELLVRSFSLQELDRVCFEIQQDLLERGIDIPLSREIVGGATRDGCALNLIQYLDRRCHLDALVRTVRKHRPGAI